jgi:hypothetical protein
MRKMVLSGVAALGFLAIGLSVFAQPAGFCLASGEGSGSGVRVERPNLVAMVDTRQARPLLVAMNLFPPSDSGTG